MNGILFKPDMIQAIVDLRKTVTRRKDSNLTDVLQPPDGWANHGLASDGEFWFFNKSITCNHTVKPRYQVGKTVYIKEAWRITSISDDFEELLINYGDGFENWKVVPDDLAMYYYNHYFKAKRSHPPCSCQHGQPVISSR